MSVHKAEATYGPAPTGDEDPNTTAAVTDPGTAGSYVYLGLQAGALDSTHLGLDVRIVDELRNGRTTTVQGKLLRVEHGANIIEERAIGQVEPDLVLGNRWVQVTFGAYSGHRVSPQARVEWHRG